MYIFTHINLQIPSSFLPVFVMKCTPTSILVCVCIFRYIGLFCAITELFGGQIGLFF